MTLTGRTARIIIDGNQPRGYIWNGTRYGGLVSPPFTLPYTPDTGPGPLGIAVAGLGGISSGLSGGIADVASYPRALPVAELIRHYKLLTPA